MSDITITDPTGTQTLGASDNSGTGETAAAQQAAGTSATTQAAQNTSTAINLAQANSEEINSLAAKFDIPQVVRDNHAELVELIVVTKSMNDDERQYWFNILPIMSEEQIEKLRKILVTEQKKLAEINQEYNARVTEINEKYLQKYQEKEIQRKQEELKQAEQASEVQDKTLEDQLLSQLNGI